MVSRKALLRGCTSTSLEWPRTLSDRHGQEAVLYRDFTMCFRFVWPLDGKLCNILRSAPFWGMGSGNILREYIGALARIFLWKATASIYSGFVSSRHICASIGDPCDHPRLSAASAVSDDIRRSSCFASTLRHRKRKFQPVSQLKTLMRCTLELCRLVQVQDGGIIQNDIVLSGWAAQSRSYDGTTRVLKSCTTVDI